MSARPTIALDDFFGEIESLLPVLNEESDIAVVLITSSFLDECLRALLEKKLKPGSSTARKLLTPDRGALGTFSARAELAYSLGLFDKDLLQDLLVVAQMRNQFAHSHDLLKFDTAEVDALCKQLRFVFETIPARVKDADARRRQEEAVRKFDASNRTRFTISAVVLIQELMSLGKRVTFEPLRPVS